LARLHLTNYIFCCKCCANWWVTCFLYFFFLEMIGYIISKNYLSLTVVQIEFLMQPVYPPDWYCNTLIVCYQWDL